MKNLFFSAILCATLQSNASLLTFENGPNSLEGANLNKTATLNMGTATGTKLDIIGAGLRAKKVLFVNAKVYVLQLFSDNKSGFSRDAGALTSLVGNSKNVALKISMLRTVSASELAVSFSDALQANGYKVEGDLQKLIAVIQNGADGEQGKNLSLVLSKNADPSMVDFSYEDSMGKIQTLKATSTVMTQVLAIWLGQPADSGLDKLKADLIKPVY